MTLKEEAIQRCKAIVLQFNDQEEIPFWALLAQVDETLHLFPRTKEDDALYPVEELIGMYQEFAENHRGVFSAPLFSTPLERTAVEERQRLAMVVLFEYFERSGPGTAYLKALSVFVHIAGKVFYELSIDGIDRILLKFEAVLDRVDRLAIQHPSDCASMLHSFSKLPDRLLMSPLASKVECFNKAISLCKKYPRADANVLVGLYRLANGAAGLRSGDNVNQASELREELIKTFLQIEHSDHTKLDVLCAWFLQPFDIPLFTLMLLPLGVKLATQFTDRVGFFMESVEACFSVRSVRFLVMLHLPDAMQLIEDSASAERLSAIKCLLKSLMGDARDEGHREHVISTQRELLERGVQISEDADFALAETWQQRFMLKAVEMFSAPSKLTEPEGAENLTACFRDLRDGRYATNPILHPLHELWNTQFVDNRYSWTYRHNVFNPSNSLARISLTESEVKTKDGTSSPRETNHVLSHFMSNRIWMHDPSRYIATSPTEWRRAKNLLSSVRWTVSGDTLFKYDADMILLMTWLRAPAVVGRLKTKSALAILNTDLFQRLAEMLGPKKGETLFAKATETVLARVL